MKPLKQTLNALAYKFSFLYKIPEFKFVLENRRTNGSNQNEPAGLTAKEIECTNQTRGRVRTGRLRGIFCSETLVKWITIRDPGSS